MVAMPPMYITDRYARVSGISSSGVWSTLSSGSSVISPTAVSASAAPTATYIDDTNVRLTDNSSPAPKYCAMTTDTPVVTPSASDEYRYVATPATLTADSATSPRYRPTTYASTKLYMR